MNVRAPFELLGGIVLVLFGALFFIYLPHDIYDVSTDLIFIVFGLLFVRKGLQDRKVSEVAAVPSSQAAKSKTPQKKNQRNKKTKN